MNGDFATSMVLGTLLARGSVKNQDDVARIGLTAGLAGMPLGLVLAKAMADDAAAQEGRQTDAVSAASSPGAASQPPATPLQQAPAVQPPAAPAASPAVPQSTESRAMLGELHKQTATLVRAGDSLKGVASELKTASKQMAISSGRLENAAKAMVTPKAV